MAANGVVLYRGPSRLDGAPIVVVATGLQRPSENEKTGPMVQTWILRSDEHPVSAVHSGADASICGDCPLRPLNAKPGEDKTQYARKNVTLLMQSGDGWLVDGLDDDDLVVVHGAGVLWSLEGVGAIPDDDDD